MQSSILTLLLEVIVFQAAILSPFLVSFSSSSLLKPLEEWIPSCETISCQNALALCNALNVSGLVHSRNCIVDNYSKCRECAERLLAENVCSLSNDTNRNICKQLTRLHTNACRLVCRANQWHNGQCVLERDGGYFCTCERLP
jgi:hypothetical protein